MKFSATFTCYHRITYWENTFTELIHRRLVTTQKLLYILLYWIWMCVCDSYLGKLETESFAEASHVLWGFTVWNLECYCRSHRVWLSMGVTEFVTLVWNVCWCWKTPLSRAVVLWGKERGFTDVIFWAQAEPVSIFLTQEKPNTVWCLNSTNRQW
jgi:hypothetical protein